MKVFETYIEPAKPAKEMKRLVKRACDICGLEGTDNWDGGWYEVNDTEISMKIKYRVGENYPEARFGEECEVDLCPKCFKEKLLPWLKTQGAEIKIRDYDW